MHDCVTKIKKKDGSFLMMAFSAFSRELTEQEDPD
jgi:hypothetical protein